MSRFPRIAPLAVALALTFAGCTPEAGSIPTELTTAADSVRAMDGVADVALSRTTTAEPVPGNFGEQETTPPSTVDARIRLGDTPAPATARTTAGEAQRLLSAGADRVAPRENITLSTEVIAGSRPAEDGGPWLTVGAGAGTAPEAVADAVADGFRLRADGAATVRLGLESWQRTTDQAGDSPAADPRLAAAHVTGATPESLVDLAATAAELDRVVDLEAPGARYRSAGRVPDVEAVQLVADAAARTGVHDVEYLTQQHRLTIRSAAEPGTKNLTDLRRWLEAHDLASADAPLAYTLVAADHTETEGWVSGARPTSHEPHALGPFGDAAPWPADPAAPDCTGDDLAVSFGVVDSAAGTRGSSIRALNTSGRPCAVENVPGLAFDGADGRPQQDITIAPYEPGAEPGRVVVPDDAAVLALLLWRTMSTADDPDTAVTLEVTAVPGARPVELDVTTDGTPSSGLDILDGAEVRVSPWIQGE